MPKKGREIDKAKQDQANTSKHKRKNQAHDLKGGTSISKFSNSIFEDPLAHLEPHDVKMKINFGPPPPHTS